MASDGRVLGIHVLAVVRAAKLLTAKRAGVARKSVPRALVDELEELENAVNGLVQFEREAATRGTLRPTDPGEIAQLIERARGMMERSVEERDVLDAAATDAFDLADEPPAMDDPFAVPE